MKIGVPTEIKTQEYRVGLTPDSVRELERRGHELVVQSGAGLGIAATDDQYEAAGARIVGSAQECFAADLIVKVKEPQPVELELLRDQVLFTFLHLAPDPVQTRRLVDSGCVAIAYETVTDERGQTPLLAPMSEVAGRMATQIAAHHLQRPKGGRGILLGGVPGVAPAKVVVLGAGSVGRNAARIAVGMLADVTLFNRSIDTLASVDALFGGRVKTRVATRTALEQEVRAADAVIGAVYVVGGAAPKLVSEQMVADMMRGAVLVDVSIDQGGCFATSRPTTHSDPTYVVHEVVHYCVANMPGAVPRTSTYALNNATLPYVLRLAELGWRDALRDPGFANGLNVCRGSVTHPAVAQHLGYDYVPPQRARLA